MYIFLAQGALVMAGLTTTRHLPVHTPSAAVSASATGSTHQMTRIVPADGSITDPSFDDSLSPVSKMPKLDE